MKKTSMFVVSVLAAAALVGACHKKTDSGTTTPTPAGSASGSDMGSAATPAPDGSAAGGSAGGM